MGEGHLGAGSEHVLKGKGLQGKVRLRTWVMVFLYQDLFTELTVLFMQAFSGAELSAKLPKRRSRMEHY